MIPHQFHGIWLGDHPIPKRWKDCWDSWNGHNQHWSSCFWFDSLAIDSVMNRVSLLETFKKCLSLSDDYRLKRCSDVLRYALLYLFGGVYVDVDFECLRPIDVVVDGVDLFVAREGAVDIGTAIIGAVPGSSAMRTIIDDLPESLRTHEEPGDQTGPGFFAREIRSKSLPFTIFTPEMFYPYDGADARKGIPFDITKAPEAYAVHYWASIAAPSLVNP